MCREGPEKKWFQAGNERTLGSIRNNVLFRNAKGAA
jgi:hypothetical protein